MERLDPATDGVSLDLTTENLERLEKLFPEAFREGKLDFEVLREILGDSVDERPERYGLSWNGKSEARRIAQMPSAGTLRPSPEESVDWETTRNLFIEGDNLEVLKLLQKSYHRRVKMIYIDPPYNTGKDFIYSDRYQDNLETYLRYTGQVDDEGFKLSANAETDGRYHTNWLNMMYPRLKLARNLLREDGIILVSIDDHEVGNLRLLMDEIFGPENFVCTVVWEKADSPRNSARQFSEDHDYLLVYSRDPSWVPNRLPRTDEANSIYSNPDGDPRGEWIPGDPFANKPYSKGLYTLTGPTGREFSPPPGRYWRVSEEKFRELEADGRIWWGPTNDARPSIKRYLSEVADLVPRTLWKKDEVGSNRTSRNELRKLFPGSITFDTPKPVALIQRALQIATSDDEEEAPIVLDFFAGSGSTGDAVMRLNSEDNGKRRFILVQLPEPTGEEEFRTVAEITRRRLRSAGEVIREEATGTLPGIGVNEGIDLGFRVFKLDTSNIKPWDASYDDVEGALMDSIENIKTDRSEDDVLYELLVKYGLDLATPVETLAICGRKVHVLGAGALVVCLADRVGVDVVEGIAALKEELQPEIMRVVFRDTSFEDDVAKTNAVQILHQAGIDDVKSL